MGLTLLGTWPESTLRACRSILIATVFCVGATGASQRAGAQVPEVICDVQGQGSYYYDPLTMIDYYDLSGAIVDCVGPLEHPSLYEGRFELKGWVATIGLAGPADTRVVWHGGQRSVGEGTLTGLPASLTLVGQFSSGSYEGADFTLTTLCTVSSMGACFQTGSSSFSYVGELVIRP